MSRSPLIRRLFRSEDGATAVEYGLILALVVLALLVGVTTLSGQVKATWNNIATKVGSTI
ncbi:Flp family type IVb pilin [Sphingomonas montanisoli]|uniref:Flp family type IVb pilin n=1 Tax=Sphingomonas montanisoli TaxID=2606412 RepID=UPI001FECD7AF|nr:Flp family type IVb pilin [Sphingomonas montanisoli]